MIQATSTVIKSFLKTESAGGIILMFCALLALIAANSPLAPLYFETLHQKVFGLSVLHWINDALMAIFFLMVGLEIKREMLIGELSTWPQRILPSLAALGGLLVPALIFFTFNRENPNTIKGWAIPTATDIAFALGVLSLLGSRVPLSLKIFLTALAIIDDLAAIVIIAIFYTSSINISMLGASTAIIGVLFLLNRFKVLSLWIYLLLGAFLWFFVLKSGIHATIAGVALALFIPIHSSQKSKASPLEILEHALHKPVGFLIVPIFGFANAGVSLAGVGLSDLVGQIPLGVGLALFLGKQIGVFLMTFIAVRFGLARMPDGANWVQIYGVALITGIGFTMSLFIASLAYSNSASFNDEAKIGVLLGSILSGVVGYLILRFATVEKGSLT